jgi:putative ABC transport system substrate-binding protein
LHPSTFIDTARINSRYWTGNDQNGRDGGGSAAAAWPVAARAQQRPVPVIGFLNSSTLADRARYLTPFQQGVRETGYVEGQNVAIEYRWAKDQYDRLPDLAADLVRSQVAVIAAQDTSSAMVAKAATTTIPIVFVTGGNPVKLGLVPSLNRPGGNVTGVTFVVAELGAKQLGLFHELQPEAVRVGVLVDPNYPGTASFISDVQAAASPTRKQIEVLEAPTGRDIDTAFASRQAGVYTGRVLKGEKPIDLPVIQSSKFEFVINLNTAKAFGLSFPPGLLAIADDVIE